MLESGLGESIYTLLIFDPSAFRVFSFPKMLHTVRHRLPSYLTDL